MKCIYIYKLASPQTLLSLGTPSSSCIHESIVCPALPGHSIRHANKLFQQRSREIQEIFVEIASHLRWMLTGLLEQLQEDEAENKAQEVWELMFWVRDQAKGILELLEVTRDNYLGTEVVDGGILQIYIACKTEQSWKPSEISDSAETFMWKLRVPSPMPLDKWRISCNCSCGQDLARAAGRQFRKPFHVCC